MRLVDHAHDLRKRGFASNALGAHDECACTIHGGARDFAAYGFFHGDRFARHQRFVDKTFAVEHNSVVGNFFAGPNAKAIADLDMLERNVEFCTVGAHQPRRLRRQAE